MALRFNSPILSYRADPSQTGRRDVADLRGARRAKYLTTPVGIFSPLLISTVSLRRFPIVNPMAACLPVGFLRHFGRPITIVNPSIPT